MAKNLIGAGVVVLNNCTFPAAIFSRNMAIFTKSYLRLTCLMILIFYMSASVVYNEVHAQDTLSKEELAAQGVIVVKPEQRGIVLGLRAGAAIPTSKVLENIGNGTSVGPLVNAEALYTLNDWIRVGMMLEWHQHSIDLWGPKLGTLSVFSILPTVEFRPSRATRENLGLGSFIPYASLGTGVNVHSFSNDNQTTNNADSFSSTFALRLATGFDYPITSRWAFNTELAWNRDSGTYELNGREADFNASTLNLLVGVRAYF
jgi:Outer membrane protein beta-barrel domain